MKIPPTPDVENKNQNKTKRYKNMEKRQTYLDNNLKNS